jgi:hypothetical protein
MELSLNFTNAPLRGEKEKMMGIPLPDLNLNATVDLTNSCNCCNGDKDNRKVIYREAERRFDAGRLHEEFVDK